MLGFSTPITESPELPDAFFFIPILQFRCRLYLVTCSLRGPHNVLHFEIESPRQWEAPPMERCGFTEEQSIGAL